MHVMCFPTQTLSCTVPATARAQWRLFNDKNHKDLDHLHFQGINNNIVLVNCSAEKWAPFGQLLCDHVPIEIHYFQHLFC